MKYLPNKTKLTLFRNTKKNKLSSFLSVVYLSLTKYKITTKILNGTENIFIINWEKIIRDTHRKQFRYLYEKFYNEYNKSSSYYEIKRVFNWNIFECIFNLSRYRRINYHINNQMKYIINDINHNNIRNIIVFCDTVPLQNYICEYYNHFSDVNTYTLQHGFYISDTNYIFKTVYKSSNAKFFFGWDNNTIGYMKKYDTKEKRKFIKAGPFFVEEINNNIKFEKDKPINSIAIYGCGRDQVEQNIYLLSLAKYLKRNNFKVKYICHPILSFSYKIYMGLKFKIYLYNNKYKYFEYDISLVLNSSVWLELEQKNQKYYILNNEFEGKKDFHSTMLKITKKKSIKKSTSTFFNSLESLEIICSNINFSHELSI